jgi:hypothetical protein
MLQRLSARIVDALERAAAADQRARDATDPQDRLDNQRSAKNWRELARSIQLVESIEHFLINSLKNRNFQPSAPERRSDPAIPSFLFRCPMTGSGVRGFLISEAPSDDPNSSIAESCVDCDQNHLVDFKTGMTVGETAAK